MIGAGSLVLKPVEPRAMVAGTPAKVVGTVRTMLPMIPLNPACNMEQPAACSMNYLGACKMGLPAAYSVEWPAACNVEQPCIAKARHTHAPPVRVHWGVLQLGYT